MCALHAAMGWCAAHGIAVSSADVKKAKELSWGYRVIVERRLDAFIVS
jgi:hypothetical protein